MLPTEQTPRYKSQLIWNDTPTHKRQEVLKNLDISRQTLSRWINDPACIRLSQAAKLCALLDIENPLTFTEPV